MSLYRLARSAAFLALVLGAVALGCAAVRASVALDERLVETRFVVRREWCPLVEHRRGEYWDWCPIGAGQDGT